MLEAYIETIHDLQDELAAATAERARYGDMMSAALGQCENERDAARAQLASVIEDYQSRLIDAFNDTGKAVMERDAAREELAIARKVMDKVADQRDAARAEVAELRKTLRKVLDILKSGRSTGRKAIQALYAAEDALMLALGK